MARPLVPDWIREFEPPAGWTNVFSLVPSNDYLYGTETLFGDWNGQTLLLAKDGAPTGVIRALRDKGEARPWRHAQRDLGDTGGYKTNESLELAARQLAGGKLYGSATANLMLDDPRWSRSLPGFYGGPVHDYLKRVLRWVLESMPNVERVACLGAEAWFLTCTVLEQASVARQFAHHRDSHVPIVGRAKEREITAFALYHPAGRVAASAKDACWAGMASGISRSVASTKTVGRLDQERRARMSGTDASEQGGSTCDDWKPMAQSPSAKWKQPVGIRKEMLDILKRAGAKGVRRDQFSHLDWVGGFTKDKLRTAMRYLINETGVAVQYEQRKDDSEPFRWRIKP